MREFHRQDAVAFQQRRQTGDEVVQIGYMGQHVVANQQIGGDALATQLIGEFVAEECDPGRHADGFGGFCDVGGGLYAQYRNVGGDEMLQQIAVIAGDLDDLALRCQRKPLPRHFRIVAGMVDPTAGEGRKIGIVGKYGVRRHRVLDLHQPAGAADARVQGIGLLAVGILERGEVTVGERHRTKIGESLPQRFAAKTAGRDKVFRRCHRAAIRLS